MSRLYIGKTNMGARDLCDNSCTTRVAYYKWLAIYKPKTPPEMTSIMKVVISFLCYPFLINQRHYQMNGRDLYKEYKDKSIILHAIINHGK